MALSGGVLGIVGLGGGRLQQSWLLTEDACVAPMGSFPDCVLWDVSRYCKKKKKKDGKESCAMSQTGSWWARMLPKSADAKPGMYTRPSLLGSSGSGQEAEGLRL